MCNVVKKMVGTKARMRAPIRQVCFRHHSLSQIYKSAKGERENNWESQISQGYFRNNSVINEMSLSLFFVILLHNTLESNYGSLESLKLTHPMFDYAFTANMKILKISFVKAIKIFNHFIEIL